MNFRTLNIYTTIDPGNQTPEWVVKGPITEGKVIVDDGEVVAIGNLMYFDATDSCWKVADGQAAAAGAKAPALAIALDAIADQNANNVEKVIRLALPGCIIKGFASRTPGKVQYLSDAAAGGMVETAPAAANETVQKVGVALAADTLLFTADCAFSVV